MRIEFVLLLRAIFAHFTAFTCWVPMIRLRVRLSSSFKAYIIKIDPSRLIAISPAGKKYIVKGGVTISAASTIKGLLIITFHVLN